MPVARIDPRVASDPMYAAAFSYHSLLASSDHYAANPNITQKHEWTDWDYGGSVLREREVGTPTPGTPQPPKSLLTVIATLMHSNRNLTTRGNFKSNFKDAAKNAKYTASVGPANHPVWGPAFAAAVENIMEVIKPKCERPDNLFDKDGNIRVSQPLFAKKTENALNRDTTGRWPTPEDCREAFAEALKEHDVCRLVVYDVKGVLVPVSDIPENEKESFKLCVMAEIGQIKILEPARPSAPNLINLNTPYTPTATRNGPAREAEEARYSRFGIPHGLIDARSRTRSAEPNMHPQAPPPVNLLTRPRAAGDRGVTPSRTATPFTPPRTRDLSAINRPRVRNGAYNTGEIDTLPPSLANALPSYYGAVEGTTPLAHGGPTPATSTPDASAMSLRSPFVTPPRREQQPYLTPASGPFSGAHVDVDGPLRVQHSPRPMRPPHVPQVETASMGALAPPNTPVTHAGNGWTENDNNIYAAMAHSYAVKAALHYNHALPGPEPTIPAELLWYLQRSEGTPPTLFPNMGRASDLPMNTRGTPLLRRVLRGAAYTRAESPYDRGSTPGSLRASHVTTALTGYGRTRNEDAIPQHGGNPVELSEDPDNGASAANEIVNLDSHRATDGNDAIDTHELFNSDGSSFLHNTGVMLSDTAAATPYDNATPRLANDDGVNNRNAGNVEGRWTHGYEDYFGSSEHSSSSSENGSINLAAGHRIDPWSYSNTSDTGSPHETPFEMYARKQENLKTRKRKEAFQDDDDVARKSKKLFIDSSDEGSNEAASAEGRAS
ncbi:hypothetical protein B0H11DRAFT_2260124 [Mycena galericulata]|nr:hypothetical protein B0H11DRAFT_2260124 [Mycena galericulata]